MTAHAPIPFRFPRYHEDWRAAFHSYEDFKNAPPLTFAIDGFLQKDGATLIGGLSSHGKTLMMLAITKALLVGAGTKLWDHFNVLETAHRVVYLIPECGITPFKHRLKLFHLTRYVKDGRLLVHTLSKGSTPKLDDPDILAAVRGAHVMLDTAVRFGEGSENDAAENQKLADRIFGLLRAGALTVVGAQHSPKSFAEQNYMTLENVLRGTGDIGAMAATAWGIKQLDEPRNIIHIENIKPRDFVPCGPFQIIGRPSIDEHGVFRMHKRPGACGSLAAELDLVSKGGAPKEARQKRVANKELTRRFHQEDPNAKDKALAERFKKETGKKISPNTIHRYRSEIRKEGAIRTDTPSA